ncbi:MAG: SPOR domain-containing protein [Gammaproteobacteria bacterium]|nr:SPOR domain-containing protein [Gammaproteobacteria bacterium]MBU1556833.1 SPOR domain-containing protein [Gammaproteobacteria bacterium]MBU2072082.1 SPOR domain-containing protein [Gammaproteobacteria bacterium]MBU2183503.1 SPOR domain-containing protein [Gammaproteobacteria bacterium]MBU2203413.1 SPOR domain-containing protein [Gammaproteobacteria bacterium]
MPQKDYVKASRPKAKTSKPRQSGAGRAAAKTAPTAKPWLLLAITSLLIGGFIYFLWFLNQQPAVEVTTAPPPAKTVKNDDLPVKPTEEPYQYIKELENKEVKVEVTEQQAAGPYQMQCGSFRVQTQAETMKAQIAFVGFSSEIRRTEGNNGVWYRVVLGPYESKRQATADRNRLRQQGINTCQIWNWS